MRSKTIMMSGLCLALAVSASADIRNSKFRTFDELRREGFAIVPMNGPDSLVLGMQGQDGTTFSCWIADTPELQEERQATLLEFVSGNREIERELPNIELVCIKMQ